MSPRVIVLGSAVISMLLIVLWIQEADARPQTVSRPRRPAVIKTAKKLKILTKRPFNLDLCQEGVSIKLSGKRLNKKRIRFSTYDAIQIAPLLRDENIFERAYVWCRTASLYHSLSGRLNIFDVKKLDKFQGDITLNREDVDVLLAPFFPTLELRMDAFQAARKYLLKSSTKRRFKRKLLPFETDHWYDGFIPYKINDPDLDEFTRDTIRDAIALWEDKTCIRFYETKKIYFQPHIYFRQGSGCYSSIGQKPHGQEVSVGVGCESIGIIAHEIGHALGFFHEHSRPDRDRYIEIVKQNIFGDVDQFAKLSWNNGLTLGIPYDYGSVMHYGGTDFSQDEDSLTIKVKNPEMQNVIGQRQGPSFLDMKLANWNYCSGACKTNTLEWDECKHDGYRNPKNCSECVCPVGLSGSRCEKPSPGINAECGEQILVATSTEKILSSPGFDTEDGFYIDAFCPWLITASTPGKRIRLRFIDRFYFTDDYYICEDYVEVRYKDLSRTGPRLCGGEEPPQQIFHSHGSQMLISATSLDVNWWQGFKVAYSEENCGGCSEDAGPEEPFCERTVKIDCSPKKTCKGTVCPPPRKNFCYKEESFCCHGYDRAGDKCEKRKATFQNKPENRKNSSAAVLNSSETVTVGIISEGINESSTSMPSTAVTVVPTLSPPTVTTMAGELSQGELTPTDAVSTTTDIPATNERGSFSTMNPLSVTRTMEQNFTSDTTLRTGVNETTSALSIVRSSVISDESSSKPTPTFLSTLSTAAVVSVSSATPLPSISDSTRQLHETRAQFQEHRHQHERQQ